MKLVAYELRKLAGMRYLWILLALMTALCAGLFYYESGAADVNRDYFDAMDAILADYIKSPDRINAAYAVYQSYLERQQNVQEEFLDSLGDAMPDDFYDRMEAAINAVVYTDTLGYSCADGTPITDEEVFWMIDRCVSLDGNYRSETEGIISVIEGVMKRYEAINATDAPIYEYESHFFDVYTNALENVKIEPVYTHGWLQYFSYDEIGIFICVYLILAAGVVFLYERSSGTLPIIRTTRKGRIKTAVAKMTATLLMTVLAVVVFTAAVLITCYFTFGFSSASAPVQAVLTYCPYVVSLGEYALIMLAVRCVAAVMFASVIALVSSLTFSSFVTYISGTVLLVANIIVNFFITSSDWLIVNLVSIIWGHGIMSQYTEVLSFGHFHSTLRTSIVIYIVIAVSASAVTIAFGGRKSAVPSPALTHKVTATVKQKLFAIIPERKSGHDRAYPHTLIAWECSKLLTPVTTIAVIVLLIASGREAYGYYNAHISDGQRKYESYVNEHLFGEYDEEKLDYIYERFDYTSGVTDSETESEMFEKYSNGEIGYEELSAYLDERDSANAEAGILKDVREQTSYLSRLEKETSVRGWLFFDTNLTRVLDRDINIFMFAAVMIVFARIYAADYAGKISEGNFAAILHTTKKGRRDSFRSKVLSTLLISFAITAVFTLVDLAIGIATTERFFDILSAPMMSMQEYRVLDSGITVGVYMVMMILIRFSAYMLLSLLTTAASYIVKKIPMTLFIVALFTLLPYALVYMGILALRYVDFTAMLAGGKLLTRSAVFAVAGGTYVFAAVLVIAYAVLTAVGVAYVRKRTGK